MPPHLIWPVGHALVFEVDYSGFSTTVGPFNKFSAELDINVEDLKESSAKFVFEAISVDTNWEARMRICGMKNS